MTNLNEHEHPFQWFHAAVLLPVNVYCANRRNVRFSDRSKGLLRTDPSQNLKERSYWTRRQCVAINIWSSIVQCFPLLLASTFPLLHFGYVRLQASSFKLQVAATLFRRASSYSII